MKKNKMMRVASALLVAVLLTTCAISGTFAKYISSEDAGDTARVAYWGVQVSATGDDAFATNYKDETGDNGLKVSSSEKVVAPGTKGELGKITIDGTPEVVVDVDVNATLKLEGWEVDGALYCPIVFDVGGEKFAIGATYPTITKLTDAIIAKFNAMDRNDVAVGTSLADSITISWAWDFDDNGAGTNDDKDTALGMLTGADAPTIEFTCEVTVEQVD